MRKKIICVIFVMLLPPLLLSLGEAPVSAIQSTTIIKVALDYSNDSYYVIKTDRTNLPVTGSTSKYFMPVLDGYSWQVDTTKYEFQPSYTNTYDILEGNINNYDVLVMAGWTSSSTWCGMPNFRFRVESEWKFHRGYELKEQLENFISSGKGYIGHCGGALIPLGMKDDPRDMEYGTINQLGSYRSKFLKSSVEPELEAYLLFPSGLPVVSEYLYLRRFIPVFKRILPNRPNLTGTMGISWYLGWDPNKLSSQFGGIPVDLVIEDKEQPIFRDYVNDTWRVSWIGGGGFELGGKDNVTTVLAEYPLAFEDNDSTKVNAWSFISGAPLAWKVWASARAWIVLLDAVFDDQYKKDIDWEQTNPKIPIELNLSNTAALISFTYPNNENGGRVLLCGPHPEKQIWSHGKIITNNDTKSNSLWKGLIRWVNETPPYDNLTKDELQNDTSKWFLRREVAWASKKVPDDHLPPVYGRSQVVDIEPYLQDDEFTIKCCVGKEPTEGQWTSENLSLYYRYNGSTSEYIWTNWKRYDSIDGSPYRFTFNATTEYGDGKYQFYSRYNTSNPFTSMNESVPPGPDAECVVGDNIYADFTYSPKTAFDTDTIKFTSLSVTADGTHITLYDWDFGDGENPKGPDQSTVYHKYADNGTYTVTLNVTNNQSYWDNISKTIFVRNVPSEAAFSPKFKVAFVNESVNFTDNSSDVDGTIANWTWRFGDGNISYTQNASHSYSTSKFYTVTLEVTDNDGDIDKEFGLIRVMDYRVNLTDSGNNTYNSIQAAIDNASTNYFIYIENGTYTENISTNKSITLFGENRDTVIINGSVVMINPHDYELPNNSTSDFFINMTGNELLMHFNNDSNVGEDYGTSDVVYDYSGQENNGTRYGASWNTNTLKGAGCFDFDGTSDSINFSSISALSGENVTISAWIYWNGGSGNIDPIFSHIDNSSNGYCLYVNSTTDKPTFWLNNTTVISDSVLTTGWHHIVGTHNDTKLNIYVDGELKGNTSKTGIGVNAGGYIGYCKLDGSNDYYSGRIDEVAVWNRTLTDDEISIIYHDNFGVFIEDITIQNTLGTGVIPCSHSKLLECNLANNQIGVLINDSIDVQLDTCNISGGTTGIIISNATPSIGLNNILVDCNISNVMNGIFINSSSYVFISGVSINGSNVNLSFYNCDFGTMDVIASSSVANVAPDNPTLSGPSLGDVNVTYNYSACTNDSNDDQILYYFDWGDGNNTGWLSLYLSNVTVNASHSWTQQGGYYVKVKAKDVFNNESDWTTILFKTETLPPLINSVNNTPDVVGFGGTINITTNVTDDMNGNWSGIKTVKVNTSYPDNSYVNYTMESIGNNIYRYLFSDTWVVGQYNYTIWAMDNAYNMNNSSEHSFNVSAQANMSIATLKDSYGNNEYINITDPPDPPEDYYIVDRGLTWDKYYSNVTGQNVLEISTGPINYQDETNEWIPINCTIELLEEDHIAFNYGYRAGNEKGIYNTYFKPNAQDDWPVAFAYNKSTDPITHVVRSKLVGVGYLDPSQDWAYEYLQSVQSSQGEINDNSAIYENVFTGTDAVWTYGNVGLKEEIIMSNATKTLLQNHPPSEYGLSNEDSYLVFITKLDYHNLNLHNSSGILTSNFTVSDERIDLKDALGHFKCALPIGDAYELNNETVRQRLTYRILQYNGKYYLLSGLKLSDLNDMTFPVVIDPTLTVYSTTSDGFIQKFHMNYNTAWTSSTGTVSDSSNYLYIGQDKIFSIYYIYRTFLFFNTSSLPSNAYIDNATLSLVKNNDYSTTDFDITIQNGQPTYPHDPLNIGDYDKTYYSGNGGSLNTSNFQTGSNNIYLTNYSWLTKEGITKFCIRSSRDISGTAPAGNEYVIIRSANWPGTGYDPKLVIEYRNQSKIKNTGSTNISGYLLIQIHYDNNSGGGGQQLEPDWILENDTVNETTPRTINSGSQLALDTIFNGLVNTNDLTNDDGTYRVYAAFRDEDGDILQCDDDTYLVATWEFTVTF